MESTFKKIDLDRSRGLCFYMAFCYLPTETVILTGDLVRILHYAHKNFPTSHAALTCYRDKQKVSCSFELLGKNTSFKDSDFYFLRHISHKRSLFTRPVSNPHSGWALYHSTKEKKSELIKFYRKMPRQYLSFFAQLNNQEKK